MFTHSERTYAHAGERAHKYTHARARARMRHPSDAVKTTVRVGLPNEDTFLHIEVRRSKTGGQIV